VDYAASGRVSDLCNVARLPPRSPERERFISPLRRQGSFPKMPDDHRLRSLVQMYETAIADLRSLDDRGVEALIARLETHQEKMLGVIASRAQPFASRSAEPS
jgi:hypothetical protein